MQNNHDEKSQISILLQRWYAQHKRSLPWRETNDPYRIWISEIILQQTRVNQGMEYYRRFIARFPDVTSLAEAPEIEVLRLWQGLGYYSRARNLHEAAKQIAERFNGNFPEAYRDIASLKGVGEYTAAAIASIAYGQPYAVVDGNVYRVLSRLFAIGEAVNSGKGKKIFSQTAREILDSHRAAVHNQAMMDLGATVCTPRQPRCADCPLQGFCAAHEKKEIEKYPVKKRTATVKERYFHYFHIIDNGGATWIHKRTGNDIWKNLYEFPLIETGIPADLPQLQCSPQFERLFARLSMPVFATPYQIRHVLSHQRIHASIYRVETKEGQALPPSPEMEVAEDDLFQYPLPRLIHKYLETI